MEILKIEMSQNRIIQNVPEEVTGAIGEEPTSTTVPSTTQKREEEGVEAMEIQKRTQEGEETTQKRDGNSPLIVVINEENYKFIRRDDYGMIENPDGTLSRTPQYETRKKNILVQLKEEYDSAPNMPVDLLTTENHPEPCKLNLNWSYDGKWVLVPKYQADQGSFLREFRVGRIETYIDLDGTIKRALSYGDSPETINTWFKVEDIRKLFPKWNIPQPGKFYNRRKFNLKDTRESANGNQRKPEFKHPSLIPGDQSSSDIQGFREGRRYGQDRRSNRNQSPDYSSERSDREGRNGRRFHGYGYEK